MHDDEIRDVALSYQKQVWNAALRHARDRAEAEESFQETYRRAFESGGTLRSLAHCRAWLFRILTSLVIDTRRRERRSPILALVGARHDTEPVSPPEPAGDFQVEMLDRLSAQEIARLINALPGEQRDALTLCDVEGASYKEIAEILSIFVGDAEALTPDATKAWATAGGPRRCRAGAEGRRLRRGECHRDQVRQPRRSADLRRWDRLGVRFDGDRGHSSR